MATEVLNEQQARVGYKFYRVDPVTGDATLLSQAANPPGQDTWTGYFHGVATNGTTLYRPGYQNVTSGEGAGVGVTDISSVQASYNWVPKIAVPARHEMYISFNNVGSEFYSLSQRDDISGALDLVQWSLNASSTSVVWSFANAHPVPFYGPLAEILVEQTYAAFVVQDGLFPRQDKLGYI